MLQRVLGAVLVALGVVSAALAVASATVWRPADVVTASSTSPGEATLLVVEPGVLDLVSDDVSVTASRSDGGDVVVALGREVDVRGWVGDDAHLVVTGLASWDVLATGFVAGETTPVEPPADATTDPSDATSAPSDATTKPSDATTKPSDATTKPSDDAAPSATSSPAPVVGTSGLVGPDPAGSDMWLASESGTGSVSLPAGTPAGEGRTMLLVAAVGDGAPAPTLTLTWHRDVATPWLVPGLVVGVLLLAAGVIVIVAASRGGLRAVGASTRRSILETSARTAATLRRGERTEDTTPSPRSPATPEPTATTGPEQPVPGAGASPAARPAGPPAPASPPAAPRPLPPYAAAPPTPASRGHQGDSSTGATAASPYAVRPQASSSAPGPATAADAPARPLTRRELREQAEREAALAAQEKSRRRPRTGALPTVRAERASTPPAEPAAPQPPQPAAAPAATDESSTARADAWRRAWGFEQQTWTPDPHDTNTPRTEEDA